MRGLILLALFLAGCTPEQSETLTREEALGRARYRQSCVQCHHFDPKQRSVGPALYGVKEDLLIDRLKNGYRGMPKQPDKLKHVPVLCAYLKCEPSGKSK